MTKMGRPKIEIDYEEFEKLCGLQCTLVEIAGWFLCSEDTIEARCKDHYGKTFAEIYKEKSAGGKISLRRHQFAAAEKGNTGLLIWLGKQYLGQKERQAIEQTTLDVSDRLTDEQKKAIAKMILEKDE